MKNFLIASALGLAVAAAPMAATAQVYRDQYGRTIDQRTGRVIDNRYYDNQRRGVDPLVTGVLGAVVGTVIGSQINRPVVDQRYGTYGAYGYPQSYYGVNRCDRNDTPVQIQGLRTSAGALIATNGRVSTGYGRLSGDRFRPASVICLDDSDARGRVTIVHDVNNNGRFDFQDGVAQARIQPRQAYRNAYGAQVPEIVQIRYGTGYGY